MSPSDRAMPVTQARAELSDLVNRVAYTGERITLTRHGRIVGGLVSAGDLQLLAELDRQPQPANDLGFAPAGPRHTPAPGPGYDVAARKRGGPQPKGT